jgi:hypothetical protein
MKINFQQDWIEHISQQLTMNSYKIPINIDPKSLTQLFLNLKRRLVKAQKRKIMKSKEFFCPIELLTNLANFEVFVENGKELKPFLSTLTSKLSERDLLINDWGIHHFHLGKQTNKNGYVKRTGPLLFAYITDDTIYFIQIMSHGSWYKSELVEIIHNNWPHLLSDFKYLGNAEYFLEFQKKNLRDKHANAIVSMKDGTTYFPPGGGFVGSGLNTNDIILTDRLFAEFDFLEKNIRLNINEVCKVLKRNVSDEFQIKLKIDENLNIMPYDVEKNIGFNLQLE